MTNHASATFDIDSWDQQAYDENEGASLARVRVAKTLHGDVEGTSTTELLMAGSPAGTSRAYVGIERLAVSVNGRSGTFVLHHTAIDAPDLQSVAWTVVPGLGTGELAGLSGQATITVEPDGGHTFTLDYELSESPAASEAGSR
jgi:uncharacterized protein DUF3224